MKFISKSSNLLIVLRPGLSAQPITGTPARPTVSVRFKDGVADVQSEELVKMMLEHPGFNSDYISADNVVIDPYAATRKPSEPGHVLTELKFGTPTARVSQNDIGHLPAELQRVVKEMAVGMAKQMLPDMVEATLKAIVKSNSGKDIKNSDNKCHVEGCDFVGRNANGLRLHAKKHSGASTTDVLSKSTENPAAQESVS